VPDGDFGRGPRHVQQLFDAYAADNLGKKCTCLPFGLFAYFAGFRGLYVESTSGDGPLYRTTGTVLCMAGYYVISTRHRVDKGRWHPLRPDAKKHADEHESHISADASRLRWLRLPAL
jgi:hypothetical protein